MKENQILAAVMAGKVVCVGTYLSGKADTINVRDKKTGAAREMVVTRQILITETEPIAVTGWLRDGEKAETFRPAAKKGDRVIVEVTKMEVNMGQVTMAGTISVLA